MLQEKIDFIVKYKIINKVTENYQLANINQS